ncbi:Clp protease [Pseudanabaena phage Pan4]|nr:Clp protease [Pseudanabaena phage Pan4]
MTPYMRLMMANKGKGEFRAEDNTIWLYDVIASDEDEAYWWGGIAPKDFIAALAKTSGPVTLRINSPGGSVFGAQAMVAAMRSHPHPITARIDSLAASAASVIAANCAETVMVPGSMLMIHRAWGVALGNCEDMRSTADLLDKIDGLIADAYAARAGEKSDKERFAQLMAAETWFTPEEAVKAGLADAIAEENTQRAKNMWDLSAFAAPPAPAAVERGRNEEGSADDKAAEQDQQAQAATDAARKLRMMKAEARLRSNPI